ncbi:MAG: serine/threonine-protein kinase [Gemmatales bacterium]
MSNHLPCVQCGNPVGENAPGGLCAACLLKPGLNPSQGSAQTAPFDRQRTAPSIADLAPHFPDLEIIQILGQGGMGAVYQARQLRLDRLVALKILPKVAGQEAEFANRFAREARAMARLNHPNIVNIHDYGDKAGWCYFIMEYVDGVNLRQAIQAKSVEPKEAMSIVGQVCDALQYAHQEGVVHRDIKPENILLDKRGRVKIADFGLAKLLGGSTLSRHLTATNQVMGTVGYMAPEQMEGSREVDQRADIFSLGVVFYELLTGELPLGRFVPPSQKVQIDVRIDEVVLKTLEKEPDRRYQFASQIKQDVEQISRQEVPPPVSVHAKPAGDTTWVWLHNLQYVGATLLALGLLEFGIFCLGMFQVDDLHVEYSERNKTWFFLTTVDLFFGAAVAVAGMLMLWRRWWPLAMIGAFLAVIPLTPLCLLIRPQTDEVSLKQLIDLAEKQGIKFNSTMEEARGYSFEARNLRDRIINWSSPSRARLEQLIYVRWPTILVTLLSIPAGILAIVLLLRPEVREAFHRQLKNSNTFPSPAVPRYDFTPASLQGPPTLQIAVIGLLTILTLGFGSALLVWLSCALAAGDPIRTLFNNFYRNEYTFHYFGLGIILVWIGVYLLSKVLRTIKLSGQELTSRAQFAILAILFLGAATGLIYVTLNTEHDLQRLALTFQGVIAYRSEAAGWIAGLLIGGLLALLLAFAPVTWQSIKRMALVILAIWLVLVVLAFLLMPTSIQTIQQPERPPSSTRVSVSANGGPAKPVTPMATTPFK